MSMMPVPIIVLIANLVSTCYMVGLIWMVQDLQATQPTTLAMD